MTTITPGPFPADYANPGESRVDYLARVRREYNIFIVEPTEWQVQIDIDSEEQYQKHKELLSMLSDDATWINIDSIAECPSKSGDPAKRHITITFDRPISDWERIAWQAALGSDLKRELFSCVRLRHREPVPICFFETSDTLAKIKIDDRTPKDDNPF